MFFIIMFLSTAGTSKLYASRDLWHSGWWSAKIIMWITLTVIPFLMPSSFIQLYGSLGRILQILSECYFASGLLFPLDFFQLVYIFNHCVLIYLAGEVAHFGAGYIDSCYNFLSTKHVQLIRVGCLGSLRFFPSKFGQ